MATGRERSAHPGATPPISRVGREPPRRQAEGEPAKPARGGAPETLRRAHPSASGFLPPERCIFSAEKRGATAPLYLS